MYKLPLYKWRLTSIAIANDVGTYDYLFIRISFVDDFAIPNNLDLRPFAFKIVSRLLLYTTCVTDLNVFCRVLSPVATH